MCDSMNVMSPLTLTKWKNKSNENKKKVLNKEASV